MFQVEFDRRLCIHMQKKLTIGSLDSRSIGKHRTEFKEKERTIYEEAEHFLNDKEILEQQFEDISESSLSTEDKRKTLEALKELALMREKDFNNKIIKERERLQEEQQREIDDVTSGIEELSEKIDMLENNPLEANSVDASSVIETLKDKKSEFEVEKEKYKEQLRLQIQQAETQARNMRNKKF